MNDGQSVPFPIPDVRLVDASAPILREKAADVPLDKIDDLVAPLLYPMKEIMRKHGGIGLAAPQVGVGLRFFLMEDFEHRKVHVAINPVIHQRHGIRVQGLEGCLSFPDRGDTPVPRWTKILLEWRTTAGEKRVMWFKGRDARVIQHETDHLDGICIFQ